MLGLRACLARVRSLGLGPATPARLARQILTTNAIAMLAVVISVVSIPYDLWVAPWWMPFEDVGTLLASAGALALNARGRHTAAPVVICAVGNLVMLFNAAMMGREAGAHLTFFALAVLPYMLFGVGNERWKVAASAVSAASFVGLELFGFRLADANLPRYSFPGYYAYSATMTFVILIVIVRYFVRSHLASEDALLASEEQHRQITLAARDAIVALGPADEVVYASPAAEILFGADPATLLGRPVGELVTTPAELHGDGVLEGVGRHRTDGPFPVEITVGASAGAPGHRTLVVRDVSERARVQAQLERARADSLESARLASLGELSSGVAHEINNPLTAIGLAADHLRRSAEGGVLEAGDVRYTAERIQRIAGRIDKIVSALRVFARDGAHDPMEVTRLGQIVDDTLELCGERLRQHDIELRLAVPAELELECRPVQISQVLFNLLTNAYDAVEGVAAPWVAIEARRDGDWVAIAVTDAGPGVPPEARAKIFQPFFTTKEVGKGTGLGLAVAHGIVVGHHGGFELDVAGPPTRFVVRLPLRQPAAAADDAAVRAAP
ncbi:MAG: ATP-binding protein [Kofleriaceae bacterium]